MLSKYWLDEHREIIHTSTLKIPERIKEIDRGYFIVYNHKQGYFEIHHEDGLATRDTLQLWIPYKELDQRTIDKILETRIENAKALLAKMERENAKIIKDEEKKSEEISREVFKDFYRYCNNRHPSKDEPDDKAYTAQFV